MRVKTIRAGQATLLLTVAAALALALCALAATLAVALCAPGQAQALPEGRVYEKVSPAFKGGYGAAEIFGVAPDGESLVFNSEGVFAGLGSYAEGGTYQATRTPSGWITQSPAPAASYSPVPSLRGLSSSLDASLWELTPGLPHNGVEVSEYQFATHPFGAPDSQVGFQPIGPPLGEVGPATSPKILLTSGFDADLCHVVVRSFNALLGQAVGAEPQMYEASAGCHGEPSYLHLVGLNNGGGLLAPSCSPAFGTNEDTFNAISADGSEIFFDESGNPSATEGGGSGYCGNYRQLFVRLGGEKTLEVSKPLGEACAGGEVPCAGGASRPPAQFWGASEDGSRVFFTTTAQLDPASDGGNDLYMAEIGCPAGDGACAASQRVVRGLVQVSEDPHVGQAAEVQGVTGIAPDGARVYFVARGVLSEAANHEGLAAIEGAENLYAYDTETAQTEFIGDLCSGPETSGVAVDQACPSDLETPALGNERNDGYLWKSSPRKFAQTTGGEGRFLVFSTYARLIATGPEADADDARDVYRYDAQTGDLQRVSLGENGYDANGNRDNGERVVGEIDGENVGAGDALIQPIATTEIAQEERDGARRAISEDGSRIVFMTAEPLSPDATNGQVDVYEWHDGRVSLLSCGCATEGDRHAVITPSGRDVFFWTNAGLVTGDTDGLPDIYDARLGGGFPAPEAPAERCEGDSCQGPLTNPAPLLVPGSVVQEPGENASAPTPAVAPSVRKSKPKQAKRCKKGRRGCVKHKRKHRAAASNHGTAAGIGRRERRSGR